jgi:iron complex outermembrane receptor protein
MDSNMFTGHSFGPSLPTRWTRSIFLLVLTFLIPAVFAQQDQTAEWKVSIGDLEKRLPGLSGDAKGSIDALRADAETLRSSVADFAAAHPEMSLSVPAPLPEGTTVDALHQQLEQVTAAVDEIIRRTPGSPFNLGRMEVNVTANLTTISPVADSIDQTEMRNLNLTNVAKALDYLPGVSIQHIATNRNEAGIMVRGFSTRGQVPLYLDGIPISVPYDGYIDFNRFLTSDISEVQVTRGYSSPLAGPNAVGGTINLVTQEPVKKLDVDALIGTGSAGTLLSALRLGTRWRRFFVQGSLDWLQSDYIPLSGNFPVLQYKNLFPQVIMTDHLNHSWSRDEKFSGRAGWTPRSSDEYVFSYISLKGQKGVPLYQGADTAAVYRTFWNWPYWDMVNYYFHSDTKIGESSSIKFRAFYDQFLNDIDMYSDDTYVMNTASAAHSMYDEHNDGASAEYSTRILPRNAIGASFFFKDDTHRERTNYPDRSPFPLLTPDLVDRDQQSTIGAQDIISISEHLRATIGFSADHFDGLQGQAYNSASTALVPFTCVASPKNTSFAGCTAHVWNFNPQASLAYTLASNTFFVTFADRGRFPMLKDIYSSGLGAGLPNPNLQPEKARSWNLGYSRPIGSKTAVQVVLFRTDLRNAIESVYVTDPGGTSAATAFCPNSKVIGFCSEMANIGSEVHQGIEFEVRSTPIPRLTLNASYSYLNRNIKYDFGSLAGVSAVNTSISILPTLPKNKLIGIASLRTYRRVLGIATFRYESGLTLQDTTYATTSPLFLPYSEAYGTMDLGVVAPIWKGATLQAGVKNIFDRNYYYSAGFPEAGRTWFMNARYTF